MKLAHKTYVQVKSIGFVVNRQLKKYPKKFGQVDAFLPKFGYT